MAFNTIKNPTYNQIVSKVNFIEEHSEYVCLSSDFNEMRTFVAEHYNEVYEDYQLELCGYVEVEY